MSFNYNLYKEILDGKMNTDSIREIVLNCIETNDVDLLNSVMGDSTFMCGQQLSGLIINTIVSTLWDIVDSGNVFASMESFKDITLEDLRERIKRMNSIPGNLESASFDELANYVNNRVFVPRAVSIIKNAICLMLELQQYTNRFDNTLNKLGACRNVDVRAFCCGHFKNYSNFKCDKEESVRNVAQFRDDFYNKWDNYSDEQKNFIEDMAKKFTDGYICYTIFPMYLETGELAGCFKGDMFEGCKTSTQFIDQVLFDNVERIVLCDKIVELAKENKIKFSEKYQSQFDSLFRNKTR